jgi:hypothetical protein
MPVVLSALDPTSGEIKLRYLEPYVTEGLNAKSVGIQARGTYRGFRLDTNAAALVITVTADALAQDHSAHYVTSDGHGLRIRRTGGNFALDVSSEAGNTILVCIYATYSIGSVTTGDIRAYTLAEFGALSGSLQAELIVLGQVVVPASGVIPLANITHSFRSWAWEYLPQDVVPWLALHTDPSFELLPALSGATSYVGQWTISDTTHNGTFSTITTAPANENALQFTQTIAASAIPLVYQLLLAPIQGGQSIRVRMDFQSLAVSSSNPMVIKVTYLTISGSTSATYTLENTVDGAYVAIDTTFRAPPTAVILQSVQLTTTGSQWPLGAAWRVNNFQVFLENLGAGNNSRGGTRGASNPLVQAITFASGIPTVGAPTLSSITSSNVTLGRGDQIYDNTHIPPSFTQAGAINAGAGLADNSTARLMTSIDGSPSTGFSLLWRINPSFGNTTFLVYTGSTSTDLGFYLVYGAFWSQGSSQWLPEGPSYRLVVNSTGIAFQVAPANGASAFAENQWRTLYSLPAKLFDTPFNTGEFLTAFTDMLATNLEASASRIHFDTRTTSRTLLLDSGTAGTNRIRVYHTTIPVTGFAVPNPTFPSGYSYAFEITTNCSWDPTAGGGTGQWHKDTAASPSFRIAVNENDVIWSYFTTSATTFGDDHWAAYSMAKFGTPVAWGTAVADYSQRKTVSSFAWPYYWVVAGYNIQHQEYLTSPARLRVTFQMPINTIPNIYGETGTNQDQYTVVCSINVPDLSGSGFALTRVMTPIIGNKTASYFDICLVNPANNAVYDPTINTVTGPTGLYQSFVVFGNSTGIN